MREYIYKDYYLKDGWLKKDGVDDHKHLLHKFGSIPCIDKKVWQDWGGRVDGIAIRTKDKVIFRIKASEFDVFKKEIDLGWGEQFYVERGHWNITKQTEVKEQLSVI